MTSLEASAGQLPSGRYGWPGSQGSSQLCQAGLGLWHLATSQLCSDGVDRAGDRLLDQNHQLLLAHARVFRRGRGRWQSKNWGLDSSIDRGLGIRRCAGGWPATCGRSADAQADYEGQSGVLFMIVRHLRQSALRGSLNNTLVVEARGEPFQPRITSPPERRHPKPGHHRRSATSRRAPARRWKSL